MMEDLVCTLDQAKQLEKKLPQKKNVLWWKVNSSQTVVVSNTDKDFCEKYAGMVKNKFYPAYTSGELMEYLPNAIYRKKKYEMTLSRWWRFDHVTKKRIYGCVYDYQSSDAVFSTVAFYGDNEAQAIAGLLIHLIKKKYIIIKN